MTARPGTAFLHITDLEAAINFWRARAPMAAGAALAPEVAALAEVYGQMVFSRQHEADAAQLPAAARAAWLAWYASTPDTPCIAICSTAQGDAVCKGCGRTEGEVQHWPALTPWAKRAVWRRITQEGTAWRFGRYADRARAAAPPPHAVDGLPQP
ncbi:MAG: DUF3717 domain-containing protein [Pseudomonadota bacterium]|nr:DUF3717 domain-containing protein [Pseudomonadota bacterium]